MRDGWFGDNSGRAFPFIKGTVNKDGVGHVGNLPDAVVVDAGFVVGVASGFHADADSIYLKSIRRADDVFYFDFASTAPGLFGLLLTFARSHEEPGWVTEFADSSTTRELSQSAEECAEPSWSGYVVTGDMEVLDDLLGADGEWTRLDDTEGVIEPALVQNLARTYLTSLALANGDRTRASAPDGCTPITWEYEVGLVYVRARCLTGDIVFKPGYNMAIRQSDADGALTFSATVGAGEGSPCDEIKLFDAEEAPTGSIFLGGGPACNEVLRSINGVGGRLFELRGGTGVIVTPVPESNTIIVDANFVGLSACTEVFSAVSESI